MRENKYVVKDDSVVEKRGNKNNSNMTSPTKRIGTYKIKIDIIQD